VASVSQERWQEAQKAEREYWAGINLPAFRSNLDTAIGTAEWVRRHISPPPGSWLDIGMGRLGISSTQFLRQEERLVAIDPIEPIDADDWQLPKPCVAMLRELQSTTERLVGRAESTDLPDDSFSVVSIENALDHVQDPAAVLDEARRVLAPGGYLLLTVDSFSTLAHVHYQLRNARRLRDTIFVRAHPHRYSARAVKLLVEDAGFHIVVAELPTRVRAFAGRHFRVRLIAT
jgi:SAM-dependent methyltransferase